MNEIELLLLEITRKTLLYVKYCYELYVYINENAQPLRIVRSMCMAVKTDAIL